MIYNVGLDILLVISSVIYMKYIMYARKIRSTCPTQCARRKIVHYRPSAAMDKLPTALVL